MTARGSLRGRRVLVTGGTGFLGQHVVRALQTTGADVFACGRAQGDLLDRDQARRLIFQETMTDSYVVHLAYPGSKGIQTSIDHPFSQQLAAILRIDLNVIEACVQGKVAKVLGIGSVCAYPETTEAPTDESQLWQGYPEPVNAPYGLAKRHQLALLQAARVEHGLRGIHLITANMYGPGDRSGHVIPSLITRMCVAKDQGTPMMVWGRPDVTRSFLYVKDAAEGVVRALTSYDAPGPLNLVSTEETSMAELVRALAARLQFAGQIEFDRTKPTGHRRRAFSNTRLHAALGWIPQTPFAEGLDATLTWHLTTLPWETR